MRHDLWVSKDSWRITSIPTVYSTFYLSFFRTFPNRDTLSMHTAIWLYSHISEQYFAPVNRDINMELNKRSNSNAMCSYSSFGWMLLGEFRRMGFFSRRSASSRWQRNGPYGNLPNLHGNWRRYSEWSRCSSSAKQMLKMNCVTWPFDIALVSR